MLPILGANTHLLLILSLVFLSIQPKPQATKQNQWADLFLLTILVWCFWQAYYSLDLVSIKFIINAANPLTILKQLISKVPPIVYQSYLTFLSFFIFTRLFEIFSSNAEKIEKFKLGLSFGLGVSALIILAQVLGIDSHYFANQSQFWTKLRRYSGSFSDPNAFGIFVVLSVPFLIQLTLKQKYDLKLKQYLFGLAGIWMFLVLYSGSRSFFLGIGIYGFYVLWSRGLKSFYAAVFMLFAAVAVLNLNQVVSFNNLEYVPSGVSRIIKSANLSEIQQTFFSRSVFWQLDWHIFKDNIFAGIGPSRFRSLVPIYSKDLGLNIGNWSDNANNFYLGIMVEYGLIGVVALLSALSCLKLKEKNSYSRAALICLAILLFFGPHFEFDEVMILSSIIFADNFNFKEQVLSSKLQYAFLSLIFLIIGYKASQFDYGIYHESKKRIWSSGQSRIWVSCENDQAQVGVRATNPDLKSNPLTVKLNNQEILLKTSSRVDQYFDCLGQDKINIALKTSRVWAPDGRILGVQVVWDN